MLESGVDLFELRHEAAIKADVALVKAKAADRWGNLIYHKSARNFGPIMCTAAAKSIVQVRRTDDAVAKADGPEAAVARIEQHLKQGNLTKALAEAKKLPESGQQAAKAWISELEARASVDGAIAEVEDQLKASLGGGAKGERKEG